MSISRFILRLLVVKNFTHGIIAIGKTTVANYLASTYNLPILDADVYAREAVSVGSTIVSAIAQRYGEQILLADGNLNRQLLGETIFNHPEGRVGGVGQMRCTSNQSASMRSRFKLLELFGTIDYNEDYNYKQQRQQQ